MLGVGRLSARAVPRYCLLTNVVGTFKFMVGNASVPHLCIICGQTSLALILFDSLLPILLA